MSSASLEICAFESTFRAINNFDVESRTKKVEHFINTLFNVRFASNSFGRKLELTQIYQMKNSNKIVVDLLFYSFFPQAYENISFPIHFKTEFCV